MAFDTFSDNLLIETLRTNSRTAEEVYSLARKIQSDSLSGPNKEAVEFFEMYQGKDVQVKGGTYEGIIHSLNISNTGFYPGSKYPINVLITGTSSRTWERYVGTIIEYAVDQLVLLEEYKNGCHCFNGKRSNADKDCQCQSTIA